MSQGNVEPSGTLKAFREATQAFSEAFNRQDFDSAFALVPPDIEWEPLAAILDAPSRLRGREAVVEFFKQLLLDFPDFRAEVQEITEPASGVLIVEFVNHVTGRGSGVAVTSPTVFQVWEIRSDPWRVHEHDSLSEALQAAGLPRLTIS